MFLTEASRKNHVAFPGVGATQARDEHDQPINLHSYLFNARYGACCTHAPTAVLPLHASARALHARPQKRKMVCTQRACALKGARGAASAIALSPLLAVDVACPWSMQEASSMDTEFYLRACRHRDVAKDACGAGKVWRGDGLDAGALGGARARLF